MTFISMLLLAAALSASLGEIVSPNLLNQPYLIRLRIELLTTTLQEKCPHLLEHDKFVGKRDIGGHEGFVMEHNYAVEMQTFDHMQALLEQCYNYLISATPDMSTTTTPITTITTEPTTTTSIPLPSQCTSSATLTLTESWRNNYSGPDPGNDDINILLPGVIWFRFTGAAGNLLKNTCPTKYSCGSSGAYWSNSLLPTRVGETVSITFYESYSRNSASGCNYGAHRGRATRCSADRGGVVYIMDEVMDSEDDTVCGMYWTFINTNHPNTDYSKFWKLSYSNTWL